MSSLLVGIRMHGLQVQQGATLALVQVQILPEGLGEGGLKPPQETRNPDDNARPGIRLASQQRNYGWHYFDDGQDSAQDSDPDKDIMVQYVNVQPRTRTVKNVETLWDRRGDDRDGEHRYTNKLGDNILDFANAHLQAGTSYSHSPSAQVGGHGKQLLFSDPSPCYAG